MKSQPDVCPACGEHRLIEYDSIRRQWYCAVCSRSWRQSVRGEAERIGRIRRSRLFR